MFKAKIMQNDAYYKLRLRQLLLALLPTIPLAIIVNHFQFPFWLCIAMIGIYILMLIAILSNQKRMNSILGNKLLEIDEKELRIIFNRGVDSRLDFEIRSHYDLKQLEKLIEYWESCRLNIARTSQ